ncbi:MAG: hypothetical protein LC104_01815 [Bacteroidales bacterium]|nr:hypothetical protein [Bacteroidales bacterium]
MLSALALAMATLAPSAPLPRTPEAAVGAPPMILHLKPDADGKVRVPVQRTVTQRVQAAVRNGNQIQRSERVIRRVVRQNVELQEVQDLQAYSADGKTLDVKDTVEKLSRGAVVIASSDGKKVSPEYLKLFRDPVVVLVSPELVSPASVNQPIASPGLQAPGIRQPLPAPLPAQPQIEIQLQPAPVRAAPLQPAPVPPLQKSR